MTVLIIISFAVIAWLMVLVYSNNQPAVGAPAKKADNGWRDVKIEVPDGYDYLSFSIAGTSFRRGLSKYVGEFDGQLVAEPDNVYDPNAIKVVHEDGHHLGYIPQDDTLDVRNFLPLPCDCHGILQKERDTDGHVYYWGEVVIVKKRQ